MTGNELSRALAGLADSILIGLICLAIGTCWGLATVDVTVNVNEPATLAQPTPTSDGERPQPHREDSRP